MVASLRFSVELSEIMQNEDLRMEVPSMKTLMKALFLS